MKVKLLNNGGFLGMGKVKFPVIVEGTEAVEDGEVIGYDILGSELIRVLAREDAFEPDMFYTFLTSLDEAIPYVE